MLFFLIYLLTTLVTNTYVRTYFSQSIYFIACNSKAVKTSHKQYCGFQCNDVMLLLNVWGEDFWLAKKITTNLQPHLQLSSSASTPNLNHFHKCHALDGLSLHTLLINYYMQLYFGHIWCYKNNNLSPAWCMSHNNLFCCKRKLNWLRHSGQCQDLYSQQYETIQKKTRQIKYGI
jgi:hypothetical protein